MNCKFFAFLIVLVVMTMAQTRAEEILVEESPSSGMAVYCLPPGTYRINVPPCPEIEVDQLIQSQGWNEWNFLFALFDRMGNGHRFTPTAIGDFFCRYLEARGEWFPVDGYWWPLTGEPEKSGLTNLQIQDLNYFYELFREMIQSEISNPDSKFWAVLPKPVPGRWQSFGSVDIVSRRGNTLTIKLKEKGGFISLTTDLNKESDCLFFEGIANYNPIFIGDEIPPYENGSYLLSSTGGSIILLPETQQGSSIKLPFMGRLGNCIVCVPGKKKNYGGHNPPDGNDNVKPSLCYRPDNWFQLIPVKRKDNIPGTEWDSSPNEPGIPIVTVPLEIVVDQKLSNELKIGFYKLGSESIRADVAVGTKVKYSLGTFLVSRSRRVSIWKKTVDSYEFDLKKSPPLKVTRYKYTWLYDLLEWQKGSYCAPIDTLTWVHAWWNTNKGDKDPYKYSPILRTRIEGKTR